MKLIFTLTLVLTVCFSAQAQKKAGNSKEHDLYNEMTDLTESDGGMGMTGYALTDFECVWKITEKGVAPARFKNATCSYTDKKGERRTIKGPKAERLGKKIDSITKLSGSCSDEGGGTCDTTKHNIQCVRRQANAYDCMIEQAKPAQPSSNTVPLPPARPSGIK